MAAWRLCGIDTAATEHGFTADNYGDLAEALGRKLREADPATVGAA